MFINILCVILVKTLNRIFAVTVLPRIDTFCEANPNIIFMK